MRRCVGVQNKNKNKLRANVVVSSFKRYRQLGTARVDRFVHPPSSAGSEDHLYNNSAMF